MTQKDIKDKNTLSSLDAVKVQREFESLGVSLSCEAAESLALYLRLLLTWNKSMNLVGLKNWQSICHYLLIDSWYLARFLRSINLPASPFSLDLGAGAGLPGIPLRMFWPVGQYVLVECRQKRSAFLQFVISQLSLGSTQVFPGRVEDLPANMAQADLILSRAFCPWPDLLSLTRNLLNKQGKLVVLANQPAPQKKQCPKEWEIKACKEYYAAEKKRYFWFFAPISAPN